MSEFTPLPASSRKPLGSRTNTSGSSHKTVKVTVKGKTSTLAKKRKAETGGAPATKRAAISSKPKNGFKAKPAPKTKAPKRMASDYKGRLDDLTKAHDVLTTAHESIQADVERLGAGNIRLVIQIAELNGELEAEKGTVTELGAAVQAHEEAAAQMRAADNVLREQLVASEDLERQAKEDIASRDATIVKLQLQLQGVQNDLVEANAKINSQEVVRRRMHNSIQDLKGNIRVFCRVRPSIEAGCIEVDKTAVEPKALSIKTASESVSGAKKTKKAAFSFDRVFGPTSTQAALFDEVSSLVQSSLDGYNICIFAYGQTGSGKTYTMEGGASPESKGMIPRAVDKIFTEAAELTKRGWVYTFEASYVEIYNETVRDLLVDPTKDANLKHDIRGDGEVSNITTVAVESSGAIHELLAKAGDTRSIAKTKMNANSSRSHSIFRLKLVGENTTCGECCKSMLNLIDLAGSERVDKSGATGARLAEANAINKSLSSLGTVISALGSKSTHVPYRNSKLTHLLQNSLGGNSKCLMLANVSPECSSAPETKCSLQFATRVNETHVGSASKQAK